MRTALIFLLVVTLYGCGEESAPEPDRWARQFELSAPDEKTVRLSDFRGRWAFVFFGFTHCPDICPTALYDITEILKDLGPQAADLQPIFITVDPARDTPELLSRYMANFDDRIVALTGNADQIAATLDNFDVYAEKRPLEGGDYTMDHTAAWFLIGPTGQFVRVFASHLPPEEIAANLANIMERAKS